MWDWCISGEPFIFITLEFLVSLVFLKEAIFIWFSLAEDIAVFCLPDFENKRTVYFYQHSWLMIPDIHISHMLKWYGTFCCGDTLNRQCNYPLKKCSCLLSYHFESLWITFCNLFTLINRNRFHPLYRNYEWIAFLQSIHKFSVGLRSGWFDDCSNLMISHKKEQPATVCNYSAFSSTR